MYRLTLTRYNSFEAHQFVPSGIQEFRTVMKIKQMFVFRSSAVNGLIVLSLAIFHFGAEQKNPV